MRPLNAEPRAHPCCRELARLTLSRSCPARVADPNFSRASGGRKDQQTREHAVGIAALLRPGGGLGTLALCQLACSAATLAVPPPQQPQSQNLALEPLQQLLLLWLPLLAVVAEPVATAAAGWLKSTLLLRKQSVQSIRRSFGCGALQMQSGALLAFALVARPWQQLNGQKDSESQTVQAAAVVLQAGTVVLTTVVTNEIVLQTIELAAQKHAAQLGLVSGVIHSVGVAPAALVALVLAQPAEGGQQATPAWAIGHLSMCVPLAVAACLCLAGAVAFGTSEASLGSKRRPRTK